jgi:hypothetical protein
MDLKRVTEKQDKGPSIAEALTITQDLLQQIEKLRQKAFEASTHLLSEAQNQSFTENDVIRVLCLELELDYQVPGTLAYCPKEHRRTVIESLKAYAQARFVHVNVALIALRIFESETPEQRCHLRKLQKRFAALEIDPKYIAILAGWIAKKQIPLDGLKLALIHEENTLVETLQELFSSASFATHCTAYTSKQASPPPPVAQKLAELLHMQGALLGNKVEDLARRQFKQ